MAEVLQRLIARLGPPSRTYNVLGANAQPEFVVRWSCGCSASGPGFDRLELRSNACPVHASQRALTTLRFRLPDFPR